MKRKGIVSLTTAMLVPDIDVSKPLFEWTAGQSEMPDFGPISWKAKYRLRKFPVRTVIVTAKEQLFGERLRSLRTTEIQHDTMLSAVFLSMLAGDNAVFEAWNHEDTLWDECRNAEHIPDAVIRGSTLTFVECIGCYSKQKLESIHKAFCDTSYLFF